MMRRANLHVFPYRRSTVRVAIEEYGEAHDWTDQEIDAAMAVAALVTGEKEKRPGPVKLLNGCSLCDKIGGLC